jgi:hypothetical protein
MTRMKLEDVDSAPACRAKAASLRVLAERINTPSYKERALEIARAWDAKADELERPIIQHL